MSFEFISCGGLVPRERCQQSAQPARGEFADQAFEPTVEYSHPPVLNIGNNPDAGSVSLPINVPVRVIVTFSCIPDVLPVPDLKMRLVIPSLSRTEPLRGKTTEPFCQLLAALLTVPSARTSRCAVSRLPFASDTTVQGRVVVFVGVNDQSPVACACVMAPPPPPSWPKRSGSALFSQAAVRTKRVRARIVGRT
jgi:hypothetical protein